MTITKELNTASSFMAAAQGFRQDYKFHGNRSEIVKQIGNAVPRNTAKALCRSLLV